MSHNTRTLLFLSLPSLLQLFMFYLGFMKEIRMTVFQYERSNHKTGGQLLPLKTSHSSVFCLNATIFYDQLFTARSFDFFFFFKYLTRLNYIEAESYA